MTVRILIVSTIFHRAKILERPLRQAGFQVAVATSGSDGLALCRRGAADLVILEAVQPDLDGFAFCRTLKATAFLRHLPVCLATPEGEPGQRFRALEAGADECLSLPMEDALLVLRAESIAGLVRTVESVRRAAAVGGLESPAFDAGSVPVLVIDPDERSRQRLEEILSAEFHVESASRPDQAIARMAREAFGIVLWDFEGIDKSAPMSASLRQQLRLSALAGKMRLIAIGRPPEEGADDVVTRPVDRSEALLRVRIAARKHLLGMTLRVHEARLDALARHPERFKPGSPDQMAA